MAQINRSNDGTNLGPGQLTIPQGDFREQQDAIGDSLRQLGGLAEVEPGAGTVNDPLNAPFVLYVDPYTGDDAFVGGSWVTTEGGATPAENRERELRRIELQRLRCGYTEARPFKTINRAVIEAGLITSKAYFNNVEQDDQRVCIVLKPGVHTVLCGAGNNANSPGTLANDNEITFTDDQLRFFNPNPVAANGSTLGGGVILPRGCSMVSLDLRKTILRPEAAAVPSVADEAAPNATTGEYSNRATIFRVTGEGYYYGFTFVDAEGVERSHHLLSCFEFATIAQLTEFYGKLNTVFQNVTSWDNVGPWITEGQIVGEQPINGQDQDTDTTASASPYIYNCSIRSEFGLCGIFANRGIPGQGTAVGGFGSMVVAQYTGVSLQKDMSCWERFTGGAWTANPSYNDYINNTDPDDLRMDPNRRSFHVRAVNRAVIQEVSVFAIGQGIHHHVESGGELTVTNSNSNFGGCSALAEGFQPTAYPVDTAHGVAEIKRATDLTEETNNIRRIFIGTIQNTNDTETTTVELTAALSGDTNNQPDIIDEYTLRPGSRIWVEAPNGADYRTTLGTGTVWDASANQNQISIGGAFLTDNADGNNAPGSAIGNGTNRPSLNGLRLYIRRLVDTRTVDERRYSLILSNNSATSRTPQRDYIIQPRNGEPVYNTAPNGGSSITAVLRSAPDDNSITGSEIELKRIQPDQAFDANRQYLPGDPLTTATKHLICVSKHFSGAAVDLTNFEENFVHMEETYDAEDYWKNVQPVLLFDNDQDQAEASTALSYILDAGTANNVWTGTANIAGNANQVNAALIQGQYRWATDYLGLHQWMVNSTEYGNDAAVHALLAPQTTAVRMLAGEAEEIAFRRPSNIRLYSHAFEWAGFSNYTKAIPQYQGEMTGSNKFTFYATDQGGGRVYFTGFNEEGFGVSNRGVENLQTGEIVPPEAIDAPDRDIEFPTFFDNLEVNNLTVNQSLTSPGQNNFQNSTVNFTNATIIGLDADDVGIDSATTTEEGLGEIASIAELTDPTAATTDAQLDAAGANFVTPEGLQFWAQNSNVLFARQGITILYVGAESGGSNTNPVNDSNTLPNDVTTPVSLNTAVAWANTNRSPFETVEFRLDRGIYTPRDLEFNCKARVLGWNHASDQSVGEIQANWYAASGTTSGFNAPHFVCDNIVRTLDAIYYDVALPRFRFREDSVLQGIVYWDADRSAVFRGFASVDAKTVAEKAALGVTHVALSVLTRFAYCARYHKQLDVRNLIIGAIAPSTADKTGGAARPALFDAQAQDASLRIGGIVLRGNVGTTALSVNNATESYAHSSALVSAYEMQIRLGLGYGGATSLNTNITLQDIDGNVPADTDTKDTSGPKMGFVFNWNSGIVPYGQYVIWSRYAVTAGNYCGWNGMFHDGTEGTRLSAPDCRWSEQYWAGLWVEAGNGDEPSTGSFPSNPGEIGPDVVFADLNIEVNYCKRGIDVNIASKFENDVIL